MTRKTLLQIALPGMIGVLMLGFQNCSGPGSPAGGGSSTTEGSSKSGGTTVDNPKPTLNLMVASSVSTGGADARLCMDEVRFGTPDTPATPPGSIAESIEAALAAHRAAFNAAMAAFSESLMGLSLTVHAEPTLVKEIKLPPDTYTNIDVALKDGCSFGSFSVPTNSGPLQVTNPQVLHFKGSLDYQSGVTVLNLDPILKALSNARTAAEIKAVLASVSGTF